MHHRPILSSADKIDDKQAARLTPSWILSQREDQIIQLLIAGFRNLEIANCLEIGPETVKTHIKSLVIKMGAKNRISAAVEYALLNPEVASTALKSARQNPISQANYDRMSPRFV